MAAGLSIGFENNYKTNTTINIRKGKRNLPKMHKEFAPDSQFQFVDHETCVKLGGHSFLWPPPLFPGAFRPQQPAAPEVQDSSPEQPIPVAWPDGEITLDDLKKALGKLKGRRNRKMPKFDTEGGFRF